MRVRTRPICLSACASGSTAPTSRRRTQAPVPSAASDRQADDRALDPPRRRRQRAHRPAARATSHALGGVPATVTQLLSNHYNDTRAEYYRQLKRTSDTGDVLPFLTYASRGLVDGLEEQLGFIWDQQFHDRWEQYVYQSFGELRTETDHRRLKAHARAVRALPRRCATQRDARTHAAPRLSLRAEDAQDADA
jgi:hypothetical protein